jgi:outer membrane protein assembly factor BamB
MKFKHYTVPIAIILAATLLSVSFLVFSSSYPFGSSAVKPLPILPLSVQASTSPNIVQLWNLTYEGSLPNASPTFSNGDLYAETAGGSEGNGYAYCLNASTGAQIWNFTFGMSYLTVYAPYGFAFSPVVSGSYVYVGGSAVENSGYREVIFCLNALTGTELWNFTYGSLFSSAPAVSGGYVYAVAQSNGNVYALNAETGASVWNYTTGATVESAPTALDNMVYVSSGNTVIALNGVTGAELWNYPASSSVGPTAVNNGVVYFASGNLLFALDSASGAQIWNASTPESIETDSPPSVANDMVFVSSNDTVYSFYSSTGAQVWSRTTAGLATSPTFSGGDVYLGSNGVSVYCLSASTGDVVWNITVLPHIIINDETVFPGMGEIQKGPILYAPTLSNGVVYVSLSAEAFSSLNGGDVQNAGFIFALGPATAIAPSPTPSKAPATRSGLELTFILVAVAAVILAALFLIYRSRRKILSAKTAGD